MSGSRARRGSGMQSELAGAVIVNWSLAGAVRPDREVRRDIMQARTLVGLGILLCAASVRAAPYEIVAVYRGKNADKTARVVEVKLADKAALPSRADGIELDSVMIRFDRSGLGSITPGAFRNFAVATKYRDSKTDHKTAISIPSSELNPSASRTLVDWSDVHDRPRTTYFDVSIHGKFSPEFLCSQELYLREIAGKPHACTGAAKQPGC